MAVAAQQSVRTDSLEVAKSGNSRPVKLQAIHCDAPEQVLAVVREAFESSSYKELRNVRAGLLDGKIVLEGKVSSYFIKQMAQEVARRSLHGYAIDNRLTVLPSSN